MHCINCRYDLSETDPDGRCPECGLVVAESTGLARAWTSRRLVVAQWMLRSLRVSAVAFIVLTALGLFTRALDVGLSPAFDVGAALVYGLAVAALLAAVIMAWIVVRSGPRPEGWVRTVVPALVLGGVGSIVLGYALAAFWDSVVGEYDGIGFVVAIIVLSVGGFGAVQAAPLAGAWPLLTYSREAAAQRTFLVAALAAVALAVMVGLADQAMMVVGWQVEMEQDPSWLTFIRIMEVVRAGSVIVAMLLVATVASRLGRAIVAKREMLRAER